ncbi:TIR domain-containing protein [Microbacterium sp. CFBP9023]|uniref:TIR domain-containing protein n=1 Tax=Microbacterium sp. CFBP9023 TaxID=3096535 RepID=UPI002A6AAFBB|nr:TIR domain-containing protein [Microbacterium sp. CFBP9023]MDY0985149.1 TIR domain-containing protein [Microbacterium sp. CFBP9023]
METTAKAFWSYAHADNTRENDRILRLADLVRSEYELLTGTTIEIFTDRSEIAWGDDFRQKLDQALQETSFFIPILTPTYFLREECRKELSQFVRSAKALGLQQLLMSIRYIPVVDLTEESPDELKAVAARMQYELWDGMRLVDEHSAEHRIAVNRLAARLAQLATSLESESGSTPSSGALGSQAPLLPAEDRAAGVVSAPSVSDPLLPQNEVTTPALPEIEEDDDDDAPGLLDLVADAQPAMEAWTDTLSNLGPVITEFNTKVQAATARMNQANTRPDAFARKIVIARELAAEVEPELSELERLSKDYASGLLRIDSTFRGVFALAALSPEEEAAAAKSKLKDNLSVLVQTSREAMSSLESAADAARNNAKLSRDLRPVLRRYETAVRNMVDGSTIIEEWESLDSQ